MFKTIKSFFNWLFNDVPRWPTAKDVEEAEAHIDRVAQEELAAACDAQRTIAQKPLSPTTSNFLKGKPFKVAKVKPESPAERAKAKRAAEEAHELIAKQPKLKKSSPNRTSASKAVKLSESGKTAKSKAKKAK